MSAKIHIKLNEGLIEAEGSEEFVKYIYESAKELYTARPNSDPNLKTPPPNPNSPNKKHNTGASQRNVSATNKSPKIVGDLNLRPSGKKQSLDDFFSSLEIGKSSREKNLVFIYYMQKILGLKNISMDHVYTCYKHVKEKVPGNLYQNLVDTKNKRGWISTSNMDDLTVTVPGENYLEHDMQKKTEG